MSGFLARMNKLNLTPIAVMMTRIVSLMLLGILWINQSNAQDNAYIHQELHWKKSAIQQKIDQITIIPICDEAGPGPNSLVPTFTKLIPLAPGNTLEIDPNYFAFYENVTDLSEIVYFKSLDVKIGKQEPQVHTIQSGDEFNALIELPAIELDENGTYRKLSFLTLKYKQVAAPVKAFKKGVNWKLTSLLSSGDWAKVYVQNDGVHAINFDFASGLGIGLSGADITKIQMFGYPGGLLPQANIETKYDDLEEIAIQVEDNNSNGKFDAGDRILFYGQNPNQLKYDNTEKSFYRQVHYYSNVSAYFLTLGQTSGKRISTISNSTQTPDYSTNSFDEYVHFEKNTKNLLKSGREWFGIELDRTTTTTDEIQLTGKIAAEPVKMITRASTRCDVPSLLSASINGATKHTHLFDYFTFGDYSSQYATEPNVHTSSFTSPESFTLSISYSKPTNYSIAFIDYYGFNYRRELSGESQFVFRDTRSVGAAIFNEYILKGTSKTVWEVTDPLNVKLQATNKGSNETRFTRENDVLREFIGFDPNKAIAVSNGQKISNQDLHGDRNIEYVIVSHPSFVSAAEKLADFHRNKNQISVKVVTPETIYNEFSSGIADISAIRNYIRFLYENSNPSSKPKYLLLFGDASYDYKDVITGNSNFVPTYETYSSVQPIGSFCTDDYYGMLDDNEGANVIYGGMEIGIGRFPVRTLQDANLIVKKIERYYDKQAFGDWRNDICVFADDEDSNVHLNDAETYSGIMDTAHTEYTIRKVYADSYKQITVGNGQRYPDVTNEFERAFSKGALVVNYSGHGGESLLGHEKFLEIPQINGWTNAYKMPLFITATCEFSRYDDPSIVSAGELAFLNPNGGAIGMLTTVRLVYSHPNLELNTNFYVNNAFDYTPGQEPTLGDIYKKTKNSTSASFNTRSFALFGDPALVLAYPKHKVVTSSVNGNVLGDSINALSQITIKGEVQDHQGNLLSGFNGVVSTTVFGSKQTLTTLVNDPASKKQEFEAYTSIIYKGKASVKNGEFTVNFIAPLDLPITGGFGKISYYAENGVEDANGDDLLYMDPQIDPNAKADFEGPKIRLFMNDTNFVFGGVTDENPSIYALIYDENGINTTGLGIGRDITGKIDDNNKELLVLNEYYESDTDDFRSGVLKYPLKGISEGIHSVKVKVWDVYNNSAEAYTEFVVAQSAKMAIQNLITYPNPFVDSVRFAFEHNQMGKDLEIEVRIYDRNGAYVTTLHAYAKNAESRFQDLVWNGKNENGSSISPGLYMFKLSVKNTQGEEAFESERIVYIPNP